MTTADVIRRFTDIVRRPRAVCAYPTSDFTKPASSLILNILFSTRLENLGDSSELSARIHHNICSFARIVDVEASGLSWPLVKEILTEAESLVSYSKCRNRLEHDLSPDYSANFADR